MSLLFMDGCSFAANITEVRRRWPFSFTTAEIDAAVTGGASGTGRYQILNDDVRVMRSFPPRSNLFISAHFQSTNLTASDRHLEFRDGVTQHIVLRLVRPTNAIQFYRGSLATHLATSGVGVFSSDQWNHLEIFLSISDAAPEGRIEARINGEVVLEFDGDTRNGATGQIDIIGLLGNQGNSYWDDIVIWDDLGTQFNDWIGPTKIEILNPVADVEQEWDNPVDTDENYKQVDDPSNPDENTSYIEAETSGATDRYELEDLATAVENYEAVHAVQVHHEIKKPDGGPTQVYQIIESNGFEDKSAAKYVRTAWTYLPHQVELDPDGSVAWTAAKINAMTLGQEIV